MALDPIIDYILKKQKIITGSISKEQIIVLLENLKKVLDEDIEGDVVEMGCNVGTTSLFIQRMLKLYGSKKEFHVYDSFQGLPKKIIEDEGGEPFYLFEFKEGSCKCEKKDFVNNFLRERVELPLIHSGWFSKIPDKKYPFKIAFAFFDGDFYSSIIDSFKKIYPRMNKGGMIIVHDYNWPQLPSVKRACNNFLEDKPEKGKVIERFGKGIIVKE